MDHSFSISISSFSLVLKRGGDVWDHPGVYVGETGSLCVPMSQTGDGRAIGEREEDYRRQGGSRTRSRDPPRDRVETPTSSTVSRSVSVVPDRDRSLVKSLHVDTIRSGQSR